MTTTASKQALLMREIAGPEKMPWVRMAYTLVAPAEMSLGRREERYDASQHHLHHWNQGVSVEVSHDLFVSHQDHGNRGSSLWSSLLSCVLFTTKGK